MPHKDPIARRTYGREYQRLRRLEPEFRRKASLAARRYQRRNPAERLERQRVKRAYIQAIKCERGCTRCGYREDATALQFHHVRGVKKFELAKHGTRSKASLDAEIAKCDVLCCNCHSIETARQWKE